MERIFAVENDITFFSFLLSLLIWKLEGAFDGSSENIIKEVHHPGLHLLNIVFQKRKLFHAFIENRLIVFLDEVPIHS